MADKIPPVPPANSSDKGGSQDDRKAAQAETLKKPQAKAAEQHSDEAMRQNTTNQGLQQDR